jgi:hypothetical protein
MVDTGLNYCLTPFCRNTLHRKRCHSPYCSKCRSRRWADKFPLHYAFKNLRVRARQRGKEFTLTREQYIEFAVKTDYAKLKGKTSLSLSIDRRDNSKGYTLENIQCLTLSENTRKQFVPFFAHQQENAAYQPSPEELAEIEARL